MLLDNIIMYETVDKQPASGVLGVDAKQIEGPYYGQDLDRTHGRVRLLPTPRRVCRSALLRS